MIDIDRDGDNDFVQVEVNNPYSRVAWFENDGPGNSITHIIKDKGDDRDFHPLIAADFDTIDALADKVEEGTEQFIRSVENLVINF